MPLLIALALAGAAQAVAASPPPDPRLALMVALYDEVCLHAFPDNAAIDRAMAAHGAVALTPEQAKTTLRDDPGRGWRLADGDHGLQIMLELPPYHACSIRRGMGSAAIDLAPYRAVVDAYASRHGAFAPQPPFDRDVEGIHVHAEQAARALEHGSEALMVITQTLTDPARRGKGETGTELRFVHQVSAQ